MLICVFQTYRFRDEAEREQLKFFLQLVKFIIGERETKENNILKSAEVSITSPISKADYFRAERALKTAIE